MKSIVPELIMLVFLTAGLVMSGAALHLYLEKKKLIEEGVATQGVVIALNRTSSKSYTRAPSIQYRTQDGNLRVHHSSEGRNPPAYQVGEVVTLYYHPDQPEEVHLEGNYLMVYVLAAFGGGFLLLSIWSLPSIVRALISLF